MERINGLMVLKMYAKKQFEQGTLLIGFTKSDSGDESTIVYRLVDNDFINIETDDSINILDLTQCSFLMVEPNKVEIS